MIDLFRLDPLNRNAREISLHGAFKLIVLPSHEEGKWHNEWRKGQVEKTNLRYFFPYLLRFLQFVRINSRSRVRPSAGIVGHLTSVPAARWIWNAASEDGCARRFRRLCTAPRAPRVTLGCVRKHYSNSSTTSILRSVVLIRRWIQEGCVFGGKRRLRERYSDYRPRLII